MPGQVKPAQDHRLITARQKGMLLVRNVKSYFGTQHIAQNNICRGAPAGLLSA